MYLSIIIPAYNEQERIGATLQKIKEYLNKQIYSYEVIVVNDGSQDDTSLVVLNSAKFFPALRLINSEKNFGKGQAIRCGILEAKGEFRLFMDADGSTSIEQLEKLLPFLSQDYQIVISSRRVIGADIQIDQPWYRLFLGWVFRHLVQLIVPLGIKDSQNGFKLFTAEVAEIIFSRQTIFRWAFDVEILAIAQLFKFKIKEVPITWVNNDFSRVTFKGMVGMLWAVCVVRWNLWFGRYDL